MKELFFLSSRHRNSERKKKRKQFADHSALLLSILFYPKNPFANPPFFSPVLPLSAIAGLPFAAKILFFSLPRIFPFFSFIFFFILSLFRLCFFLSVYFILFFSLFIAHGESNGYISPATRETHVYNDHQYTTMCL